MKAFVCGAVLAALLALPLLAAEPQATAQSTAQTSGMVDRALSWLGVKYRFGGQDEKKGFDCAGLVRRVFSTTVNLPRTAAEQFREGCLVSRDELQPGDLVFFKNTYKKGISHVGIYIGRGEFVHAASSRKAVSIDRLDSPYFESRFAGGRRVMTAGMLPSIPLELRFP